MLGANFVQNFGGVNHSKDQTQINDKIRAKELRLIGQDGEQIGVKSKREALEMAERVDFRLSGRCTECETTSCKNYGLR